MIIKVRNGINSKILALVLWLIFIAGLAMIIYPRIESHIQEQKQMEVLSEWSSEIKDAVSTVEPAAEVSGVLEQSQEPQLPQWKSVEGMELLGSILIDAIDMTEPIVRGTAEKALLQGAGTVMEDRLPGQAGNFILAGHRSWTFGRHFNRLGELKLGDLITIETSIGAYHYEVTETLLVTPDEVSVLDEVEDRSVLTLITCHPKRNPTHRLIVKAILEDYKDRKEDV